MHGYMWVQACIKEANALESEYNEKMRGCIQHVQDLADQCRGRWPEAMFLEPVQWSREERADVLQAMQVMHPGKAGACLLLAFTIMSS